MPSDGPKKLFEEQAYVIDITIKRNLKCIYNVWKFRLRSSLTNYSN